MRLTPPLQLSFLTIYPEHVLACRFLLFLLSLVHKCHCNLSRLKKDYVQEKSFFMNLVIAVLFRSQFTSDKNCPVLFIYRISR